MLSSVPQLPVHLTVTAIQPPKGLPCCNYLVQCVHPHPSHMPVLQPSLWQLSREAWWANQALDKHAVDFHSQITVPHGCISPAAYHNTQAPPGEQLLCFKCESHVHHTKARSIFSCVFPYLFLYLIVSISRLFFDLKYIIRLLPFCVLLSSFWFKGAKSNLLHQDKPPQHSKHISTLSEYCSTLFTKKF